MSVRAMRIPPCVGERLAQSLQVVEKVLHRAILRQHLRQLVVAARQRERRHRQRAARGSVNLTRLLQRALDARLQADDEAPIVLELVLRTEDLRLRRVHLRDIRAQPLQQRLAHRPLLRARGQQVDDQIELALVIEQQMAARQLQRGARHLRRHKGIAVAITADPRTESQHLRQLMRLDIESIGSVAGPRKSRGTARAASRRWKHRSSRAPS